MSSSGFGNLGSWTPQQHAFNKMVYDEAYKGSSGGGGNNNGNGNNNLGCLVVVIIVIAVVVAVL